MARDKGGDPLLDHRTRAGSDRHCLIKITVKSPADQRYSGKRTLVVGLGISGRAAAHFLLSENAKVYGVDGDARLLVENGEIELLRQRGCLIHHNSAPLDIAMFDLVVISPGVPPTDFHCSAAKKAGVELIGEVELACRQLRWRSVAISGTNGKTTVTLMVTHILQQCGISAIAAGNCGVPLIGLLNDEMLPEDAIVVAELSSFQLETLDTPHFDSTLLLNITPDHLDRYGTMEAYVSAKMKLFNCIKRGGSGYIHTSCAKEFASMLPPGVLKRYGGSREADLYLDGDLLIEGGKAICSLPIEYRHIAQHDRDNFLAAFALCRECSVAAEAIISGARTFNKPNHRLQVVRRHNGITYIDDSKGTNVDAVIKAVDSLEGPLILIAGGVDKGGGYRLWRRAFKNKVVAIVAIGQAADKIIGELSLDYRVERCRSLDEALAVAKELASEGGTVLLSPGCASYDMFRSYVHRGEEFQHIVNSL